MGEIGRQIFGNAVGEIVLLLIGAQILERQNDDGETRRRRELVFRRSSREMRRETRPPTMRRQRLTARQRERRRWPASAMILKSARALRRLKAESGAPFGWAGDCRPRRDPGPFR